MFNNLFIIVCSLILRVCLHISVEKYLKYIEKKNEVNVCVSSIEWIEILLLF